MTLASRLTFPASPSTVGDPGATRLKERHGNGQRRRPRRTTQDASMQEVCKYWMEGRCTRKSSCAYVHPPISNKNQARQQEQSKNKARHATPYLNRAMPYLNRATPPLKNKTWTWHRQADEPAQASAMPLQNKTWAHIEAPAAIRHTVQNDIQLAPVGVTPSLSLSELDSALPPSADKQVSIKCKTEEQQGGAALIANLSGHNAAVTSMVLPISSSRLLFSAGEDAMLHAWDCSSGLCTNTLHLAHPPSCLFNSFSDPHWLFIGLPGEVRVCNVSTHTQQTLAVNSPVLSLSSSGSLLAAGLQDGTILVWRFDPSSASFCAFGCLSGPVGTHEGNHMMTSSPVLSLEPCLDPGSSIIFAGSLDGTIRIWDLVSGCCLQELCAHNKAITRLLSCDPTLLVSASQDGAIKLWKVSSAPGHHLCLQDTFLPEATGHNIEEGGGALSCQPQPLEMCGVFDEANTPILFAAYSDNKVHILEVPFFKCRGIIRTESPIQAMDTGSGNILFLGSSKGNISVWKWK